MRGNGHQRLAHHRDGEGVHARVVPAVCGGDGEPDQAARAQRVPRRRVDAGGGVGAVGAGAQPLGEFRGALAQGAVTSG